MNLLLTTCREDDIHLPINLMLYVCYLPDIVSDAIAAATLTGGDKANIS